MRYHVLGVGSIGSLIAFHLKRSIKLQRKSLLPGPSADALKRRKDLLLSTMSDQSPNSTQGTIVSSLSLPPYIRQQLPDPRQSSVTLHVRKRLFARHIKHRFNNSIVLEQEGVRDIEGGFQTDVASSPQDVVASVVREARDIDADEDDEFEEGRPDRFSISRSTPDRESNASALTSHTAIPDHDGGVSLISSLEGVHSTPRASPIDSLIITTKCDSTLLALESIRHRIHPWSTIVLLQNGMGVLDLLYERMFPDPNKRPNFILASTTHGCWRKGPLDTVHASSGSLHFSVVPSPRSGAQGFERHRVLSGQAFPPTPPMPSPALSPRRTIGKGWERFAPDAASKDADPPLNPKAPSKLLSITSIPDQPSLRTLRSTVASLLSLPLDVHWEPIAEFQIRMLQKLVINACINPLTALADCKNGELFGNPAAMDAMWSICAEAGMVLEAQVREHLEQKEHQQNPHQGKSASKQKRDSRISALSTADLLVTSTNDGTPILNPALTPNSLFQEVQRVIRLTAANWSSMHSDIKNRRGSTEIDFINGYISALGRGYGINTNVNDVITSIVKLKSARITGSGRL